MPKSKTTELEKYFKAIARTANQVKNELHKQPGKNDCYTLSFIFTVSIQHLKVKIQKKFVMKFLKKIL